jgi:hypothetical protein
MVQSKINRVDYLRMRLKQGLLQLPPGMDIIAFLKFDGKSSARSQRVTRPPSGFSSRLGNLWGFA